MDVNRKLKVAFFFGAGTEGSQNFNIKTGFDYLRSSLFSKYHFEGLTQLYKGKQFFNDLYEYRIDSIDACTQLLKNFIISKSRHSAVFFEKHRIDISTILSDDELQTLKANGDIKKIIDCESIKHNSTKEEPFKSRLPNLKSQFEDIIANNVKHGDLTESLFKDLFAEGEDGKINIDMNVGISGTLDSYFHTIIDPYKYGKTKFSKIFNYYWACYFTVLEGILNYLRGNGWKQLDKYFEEDGTLNYHHVLQNIEKVTQILYSSKVMPLGNSYYRFIKDKLNSCNSGTECCGVITTNYYRFCEEISNNTIYLNGQLKFFEYPELLEVADFSSVAVNKQNIYFPFIFGQSLVKPLVSSIQVEEFNKMRELLLVSERTDVLVIMGFNINEDDNHINSFLHEYVKRGKRLIIVTSNRDFTAHERLKCDKSQIEYCIVKYGNNSKTIDKVFDSIWGNGDNPVVHV